MKVAFQIDPPSEVTINNCTLSIMEEAQKRGHELYHFAPSDLLLRGNDLFATVSDLKVDLSAKEFMQISNSRFIPLTDMDIIFIRQDPTFNLRFISTTYLLERIADQVFIINDPTVLRNHPEKLNFFGHRNYCPPTLVGNNVEEFEAFWKEHGEIVVKPLFFYGGCGIFHINKTSNNLHVVMETLSSLNNAPLIAQKFLPQVYEADKRALLLFGKIAGVYKSVPAANNIRSNFSKGGTELPAELTAKETEIAQAVAKTLNENGIYIAGIDIIDGYLTEINNVTPGGFITMRELYNQFPEVEMWDTIESHPRLRKINKSA